jgi:hypothetical protein
MRRIVIAAAAIGAVVLAVLSLSPRVGAQSTSPGFMTVDAVDLGVHQVTVTGVPAGESTPTTRYASYTSTNEALNLTRAEACHRALLLALAKPGQYLARVGMNVCTVALAAP